MRPSPSLKAALPKARGQDASQAGQAPQKPLTKAQLAQKAKEEKLKAKAAAQDAKAAAKADPKAAAAGTVILKPGSQAAAQEAGRERDAGRCGFARCWTCRMSASAR